MARLDGKQKSPLPLIIGVAALLLFGAGGYVLLANRGADGIAVQNGSVKIVDTKPGGLLEKSPNDSSADAQTSSVTDSSSAEANSTPVATGTTAENSSTTAPAQDQNTAMDSTSRPEAGTSQERTADGNTAMKSATAAPATVETATVETPAAQSSQTDSTPAPATR